MTAAATRRSDPWTSHEAAQSISWEALRKSEQSVLWVLRVYGKKGLTDPQLIDLYEKARIADGLAQQSESGIRSRRAELVKKGLVEERGHARLPSGRRAIIWRATS